MCFFLNIKLSEKTLKFNKKQFRKFKEPIDLLSVKVDQIVVSYIFKLTEDVFKYFI